ncbi:DUF3140 domain-containing protein [Schumannella sp. 10F1B-5-1]|uniref:DUF3140 domain-containing protein n=1 Tax=Schumannella sp. 10F1B-5-1 TaxID=2590780 RepID=UPI0011324DF4|nr:DUF3140 domain-containing protein [Schumannella sp. 10F1B-5-1]TPW78332.1 DUF3140 domain-containing protein [Schumannella sp. 10F1B-5-1]
MTERDDELAEVWDDWRDAVNMAPAELKEWLDTDESKSVGDKDDGESTGHRSGRRIVTLLRKHKGDLTRDDIAWMRKVVGYVARHSKQRPSGDVTDTPWRYSLMNWGHDPKK